MQTTRTKNNDRSKHIWYYRKRQSDWKCVLCGAVDKEPALLEAEDKAPTRFEKLIDDERALAPFIAHR